jgi:putative oxidoreductase
MIARAATLFLGLAERIPLWLVQLFFRLGIAGIFFNAGLGKIQSWSQTVQLFADEYKVPVLPPALAAYVAASVELACPVLLVLGLVTRLATLPMLGMCFVIGALVYPEFWYEQVLWAGPLLFLLGRGPGPVSLDRLLRPLVLSHGSA